MNVIKTLSDEIGSQDFAIIISPEGTRKRIENFRSGYYYLAKETRGNIGILNIDHESKTVSMETIFKPKENVEETNEFVKDIMGKQKHLFPENFAT